MTDSAHLLVDPALATPTVAAIAIGVVVAWIVAHRLKRFVTATPLRVFFFACRVCLGAVAI